MPVVNVKVQIRGLTTGPTHARLIWYNISYMYVCMCVCVYVVPLDHAPLSEAKSVMVWRLIEDWASCRNEPHKPTTFGSGDGDWAQSTKPNGSSSWHPHSLRFVRISDREIHITNNAIMYTYLLRPWQFNALFCTLFPAIDRVREIPCAKTLSISWNKKREQCKRYGYVHVCIYIHICCSWPGYNNFYKVLDAKPGS